ncbi:YpjP family protein [Lentibacillus sp. N15]|uniref:YpjP family protein n=1 Tax=Lentibacillus songyuanensis TaxID=3136161 RepID=UPI0031BBB216
MKLWIRKIAAILIAVMTLGMYVPPAHLNTNAEENKEAVSSKAEVHEAVLEPQTEEQEGIDLPKDDEDIEDPFLHNMIEKAKTQTITKLGPRIAEQIEDDFVMTILPNMEAILQTLVADAKEDAAYFGITEQPSPGFGERIFHVYDHRAKQDVARFHVRRELRPQEGYWFTFHYHISNDNFEKHHEIGELYWDKNVPPKWMA